MNISSLRNSENRSGSSAQARLSIGFLLLIALALGACKSRTNSPSSSQPTSPTQISSSKDVVQVFGHLIPTSPTPGSIELNISPGFHINANPATFPYLIATEVQPGKLDGVTVGKIEYPPGVLKKFQFADQPLSVYEGRVMIPIPFKVAQPSTRGVLPLKVRVQACDEEKCFPPTTLDASLPIQPAK